jgi:excisionase family DNA binding protein
MTTFSLREAAEQAGASKSTIFRAIKAGRLSATRDDDGNFAIDPAELFRVYPPRSRAAVPAQLETRSEGQDATPSSNSEQPDETVFEMRLQQVREQAALEARAKLAEERLTDLKQQLDELRRQRDKWQEQAERLALAPPSASSPTTQARDWWPWRRSA